jgi:hypothetical protein
MKANPFAHFSIKTAACVLALSALVSSASAALVTWDFNPDNLNQPVGAASQTFTSSGFSITAYGFDRVSGPDTPHELFFKNQPDFGGAGERGLGLVGTNANELNINPNGSIPHYIQFDLSSIIGLGFTDGQIAVTSLQDGEGYRIYGSNTLGQLGTQLGGTFTGLSFDGVFVNLPDFGDYDFISIAAASGRVLPLAFQAVPELGGATAAFALLAFFGVVIASRAIRGRYNG